MRLYTGRRLLKFVTSENTRRFKSSPAFTGKLKANKDPSLADEPIHLEISGLTPKQKVTLHSSLRLPNSSIQECLAHYVADSNGYISLEKHKSVGGDYKGIDPMGLFSFMRPSPLNKRNYARFLIKEPTEPFQVDFRVLNNFIPSLEDISAQNRFEIDPHLTLTRTYMTPGVQEIPVWNGNVRGTLYLPPGKGPFPGIISMSGGYPGALKYKAALLASHGFATIALKYFGEDDLTNDFFRVEMEYFEEAVKFMINHPSVDSGDGIGIVANCYGAVIACAIASILPKGLVRCVASINGWPFPNPLITYKGKELLPDYNPDLESNLSDDGIRTWNLVYPVNTESIADSKSIKIFDRHDISYLFVSGEEDGYVQSKLLSSTTEKLFEVAEHPDYKILSYNGAGHLLEHRYYPLASIAFTFNEPHFNGGRQPYHSLAQNDSWPEILDFVRKRLSKSTSKL